MCPQTEPPPVAPTSIKLLGTGSTRIQSIDNNTTRCFKRNTDSLSLNLIRKSAHSHLNCHQKPMNFIRKKRPRNFLNKEISHRQGSVSNKTKEACQKVRRITFSEGAHLGRNRNETNLKESTQRCTCKNSSKCMNTKSQRAEVEVSQGRILHKLKLTRGRKTWRMK